MRLSKIREYIESLVASNQRITRPRLLALDKKFAASCFEQSELTKKHLTEIVYIKLYGQPKCPTCGNPTKYQGSFQQGWTQHCSSYCAGQDAEVARRRAATCLDKYGVTAVQKIPEVREKFKQSMKDNYGCEYTAQSKELREKMSDTLESNYGVRHAGQSKEIRELAKRRHRAKWGVDYPTQRREIFERCHNSGCLVREVKVGGKVFRVRGYEPHAIKYLYRIGCAVEHIRTTAAEGVPSVQYRSGHRTRMYHPDIYVKVKGKWWIVEVKSTLTLGAKHPETFRRVKQKAQACLDAGYRFRLLLVMSVNRRMKVFHIKNIHKKTRKQVLREVELLRQAGC